MPAWLDLIVKTSALVLVASVLAGLMRRASAASRHVVWTGTFAAVLILPIVRLAPPEVPVRVWPSIVSEASPRGSDPVAAGDRARAAAERTTVAQAASTPAPLHAPDESLRVRGAATIAARGVMAVWLIGVACFLTRIVIGSIGSRRWGRRAHRVIDCTLLTRLEQTARALRVRRPIRLLVSTEPWMPVTWGVIRPAILVPSAVVDAAGECPERLDAVLVHEVAHIARWDAVSQLIAQLAVAVWWFNPLVWLAARQARLERERACDDAVLARGSRASDYAGHLVALVRLLAPAPLTASDSLSMARASQLEKRVSSILDAGTNRRARSGASLLLTALLMAAMLPISAVRLAAGMPPVETSRDDAATPIVTTPLAPPTVELNAKRTPQPERPQQTQQTQQSPLTVAAALVWRDQRHAMFRQLLDRARRHLRDARVRVEIGTLALVEVAVPEQRLAELERVAAADGSRPLPASTADMPAVRLRFAAALAHLNFVETRFDVGMATTQDLDDAMGAAVGVLVDAPVSRLLAERSIISVERGTTGTGDADVIFAIRQASTIAPDKARADALLALAARHAFSPEMVALYVAAANGINSAAERDRVFAQPILVKGSR
jgi:beta-lactamase regulating signal transducer with metallopeptidase domain